MGMEVFDGQYEPAGQSRHVELPASLYVPSGHTIGVVVLYSHREPAGQVTQSNVEAQYNNGQYWPAAHVYDGGKGVVVVVSVVVVVESAAVVVVSAAVMVMEIELNKTMNNT